MGKQQKKAEESSAVSVSTQRRKQPEVRAQSLADQAHCILRQKIITLQLAPGEGFKERQIAKEIGFGAMPLREAIDRLEQEGLVKTVPRRGHQVAPMTAKYVRDFFDAWAAISMTVSRLACIRATEEQALAIRREMAQLSEEIAHSAASSPGRPREQVIHRAVAIFQHVVDIADNEHLSAIWRRLSGVHERIVMMAFKQDPSTSHALDVTAGLMDAWRSRDPDAMVRANEQLVMGARAQILRLL